MANELQRAVWSVDAEQPVMDIETMDSIVDGELANRTQVLRLLGAFAGLALLLAALGVYGVLAQFAAQRTAEIAIRKAIGAAAGDILALILWKGGMPIVAGVLVGLGSSFAIAQYLRSLLYGVTATDPATFAIVVTTIVAIGAFAMIAPAVRVLRVDPLLVLRNE